MDTKSWYILAILHGLLTGLFAGIYAYNSDPWAYAIFFVFLTTFIYCFVVFWGNRKINQLDKKHKAK